MICVIAGNNYVFSFIFNILGRFEFDPAVTPLPPRWVPQSRGSSLRLDGADAIPVLRLEMAATIQQFERIFLVSQTQRLGFFLPEAHDVPRDILPDGFVGLLPVEISLDAVPAPFRNMIFVQWRTIVMGTRKGDVHHTTLCRREPDPSMRQHAAPTLTIGPSHALFRALSGFPTRFARDYARLQKP